MSGLFQKILHGGGIFFDLCKWIIFAGIILSLIHTFWFTIFAVEGISMEPTLRDKELAIMQKNYYVSHDPIRGEVVVVKYPGDPNKKRYVKRVIGLPKDTVTIANGKVFINNIELKESYLTYNIKTEPDSSWKLGSKEYFLLGDSRPNSNDSRYFGAVEKRFFFGRVKAIIYPRLRLEF